MTSFESKAIKIINKFNEGKFNLWKLKIKMLLSFIDLWNLTKGIQGTLFFQCRSQSIEKIPNIRQEGHVHQRPQFSVQPTCIHQELQRTHRGMKNTLQQSQTKSLSNILFICASFSHARCKIPTTCWTTWMIKKIKKLVNHLDDFPTW